MRRKPLRHQRKTIHTTVGTRSPSPRLYRLITHKFKVTQGFVTPFRVNPRYRPTSVCPAHHNHTRENLASAPHWRRRLCPSTGGTTTAVPDFCPRWILPECTYINSNRNKSGVMWVPHSVRFRPEVLMCPPHHNTQERTCQGHRSTLLTIKQKNHTCTSKSGTAVQHFIFLFFKSSGGWVKLKLERPHFHVSDTSRVSI